MDSVDSGGDPLAVVDRLVEDDAAPRTTAEVADALGCTREAALVQLEVLADRGRVASRSVGDHRIWWRPPDATPSSPGDSPAVDIETLPGIVYRCKQADDWPMEAVWGACADITGYPSAALESGAISFGADVIHPDDYDRVWTEIESARETNDPFCVEYRIKRPDRETRWVREHGRFVDEETLVGVIVDVNDSVPVERRLRAEEAFTESVLDAQQDVVYAYDREGEMLRWNDRLAEVTGYSDDQIASMDALDFVADDERERVWSALDPVLTRGETETVRFPVENRAGETVPVELTATPLQEDGDIIGVTGVARDISDRVARERALRQERDVIEQVLEAAPSSIVVVDQNCQIRRANGRAIDRFDLTPTDEGFEYDPVPVYDEDGEFIPRHERPLLEVLQTGDALTGWECQVDLPRLGTRWVSLNAQPVHEDGEVARVIVTSQDVTRFKANAERLERERDELEDELSEVLERVHDAVIALDDEWRFTYVNDRAVEYLDTAESALLGTSIWAEFPELVDSRFEREYRHAMATQSPVSFEAFYDPLDTWFQVNVYPSETGLSVYFQDVSDRVERDRELEEARRRYRTLLEHFPNGAVALVDQDLRYQAVGGTPVDETRAEALEGSYVPDALTDELSAVLTPAYRDALDGEPRSIETTLRDGHYRIVTIPVRDEDGTVFAALGMSQDVTEQKERERELVTQREQLDALNSINTVVRETTHAAFEQSTRDEIEAVACRHLADADSYEFAWIAERDPRTGELDVRTESGAGDYLAALDLSSDAFTEGPTARAFETRSVQTVQDVRTDPAYEQWRDLADDHEFRSSAAIPIRHEQTLYGVLNVYADRPRAFDGREGAVVEALGEILGHAIAAAERKRALMSDELVELEFVIEDVFGRLVGDTTPADRIVIEETVPAADDGFLIYGHIEGGGIEAVQVLTDNIEHWTDASVVSDGDPVRFEVRLTEPPVLTAIAAVGGAVEHAEITEGDYYMRIRVPVDAEVRQIIGTVQDAYPEATVLSHKQVSRTVDGSTKLESAWGDALTDRQRTALEVAFHSGYFSWPRDTSGEAVAETLGVSPPTFYQHLRAAEEKLFAGLLGDAPDE